MKICVLQPSYEGSASDYRHYDPPRDLSPLLPEHQYHHAFLQKVSSFAQVRALVREGFDVFVNLCEGYRDSDVPSIDVIQALEHFNVPFTGPTSVLYDPPKDLMKVAARSGGVLVPPSVVLEARPATVGRHPLIPWAPTSVGADSRPTDVSRAPSREAGRHEEGAESRPTDVSRAPSREVGRHPLIPWAPTSVGADSRPAEAGRHEEGADSRPTDVSRASSREAGRHEAADIARLQYPLFVKPAEWGDSMGIDQGSLVRDAAALERQVASVARDYGRVLIEEYIAGREFTVLVCGGGTGGGARALRPIEFLFPDGYAFKTYDLKVTQFHPECNVPVGDDVLAGRLRDAALAVFRAFAGQGYARMDFRLAPDGRLYFLEVNFACSVFYPDGYYGSADYILAFDGLGQAGFLRAILDDALARHARRQVPFAVRARNGSYGMVATRPLRAGDVIFRGEERAQRIVTRTHVDRTWSAEDREIFYRYAYPVGPEVFVLWDLDPASWAPQNHACEPNTVFEGLNVVALRDIAAGEELTLDYGVCYDRRMIPFDCTCGSPRCRGRITGGRGIWG